MKDMELIPVQTGAADLVSNHYDLNDIKAFSAAVTFTGTDLEGTLKLEASLDLATWFDVPNSTEAVTASTSVIWSVDPCTYRYIRVNWDYTSGTGNISARLFLKDPIVKFN